MNVILYVIVCWPDKLGADQMVVVSVVITYIEQ